MRNLRALKTASSLALALWFFAGTSPAAHTSEAPGQTERNVPIEIIFHADRSYSDPFNQVALDVTFTDPRQKKFRVPAFWAGADTWKVRYASSFTGTHTYRTECSESRDRGLHGITGSVEIKPYSGKNPLYVHGPLQAIAGQRYLEHADRTPFFWLGDTWWMGLCHRLHWPDEFQRLAADRKAKGFNVIQIVAGLYPDMHPFDPRGANEAGFPWTTNYGRIRPEYFDAADQRLKYLVDQGLMPCLVGAWGYFMPWMGPEKLKAHWRYLIARYSAWPVVWCAAGEANLPWYLAKGFPYDDRKQVHDWTAVMRYIRETDPFHRALTIHPTAIKRFTSRHATDDAALLDFDMLQTAHGQREAVPMTINAVRESYAAQPVMPVINGEASYEMLGDSLPTEWTRRMFWVCLMNGAAGHTYGANGIWQCNRPEAPHGASPHGGSYGKIPWNEAMNLPGSRQVGLGKRLLEQYPWPRFQPHPEWASFVSQPDLSFDNSRWIWFPEGNPTADAPVAKRFCRRTFVLPNDKTVEQGILRMTVDDWFSVRLNGHSVGIGDNWKAGKQFNELAALLVPGTNVLAIIAENKPGPPAANPAGLIASLQIRFAGGEVLKLASDADWHWSKEERQGWDRAGFDDSAWAAGMVIGKYGDGPWGEIGGGSQGEYYQPQATGIPGVVRIVYVPENETILLRHLGAQAAYRAQYFDPVTGEKKSLPTVHADTMGTWHCSPPAANDHDWVLILENL